MSGKEQTAIEAEAIAMPSPAAAYANCTEQDCGDSTMRGVIPNGASRL
jgi:hypothetical protein